MRNSESFIGPGGVNLLLTDDENELLDNNAVSMTASWSCSASNSTQDDSEQSPSNDFLDLLYGNTHLKALLPPRTIKRNSNPDNANYTTPYSQIG
ncbi:hypothetical protein HK100_005233, partial [Physocladia obscura]